MDTNLLGQVEILLSSDPIPAADRRPLRNIKFSGYWLRINETRDNNSNLWPTVEGKSDFLGPGPKVVRRQGSENIIESSFTFVKLKVHAIVYALTDEAVIWISANQNHSKRIVEHEFQV